MSDTKNKNPGILLTGDDADWSPLKDHFQYSSTDRDNLYFRANLDHTKLNEKLEDARWVFQEECKDWITEQKRSIGVAPIGAIDAKGWIRSVQKRLMAEREGYFNAWEPQKKPKIEFHDWVFEQLKATLARHLARIMEHPFMKEEDKPNFDKEALALFNRDFHPEPKGETRGRPITSKRRTKLLNEHFKSSKEFRGQKWALGWFWKLLDKEGIPFPAGPIYREYRRSEWGYKEFFKTAKNERGGEGIGRDYEKLIETLARHIQN